MFTCPISIWLCIANRADSTIRGDRPAANAICNLPHFYDHYECAENSSISNIQHFYKSFFFLWFFFSLYLLSNGQYQLARNLNQLKHCLDRRHSSMQILIRWNFDINICYWIRNSKLTNNNIIIQELNVPYVETEKNGIAKLWQIRSHSCSHSSYFCILSK